MSSGRKLRPIMPRPLPIISLSAVPSPCSHSLTQIQPLSCKCCFLHKSNTLSTSANLPGPNIEEESKELDEHAIAAAAGSVSRSSSRWNPTAEQLGALEDMYEGGTHTPTADQIKVIAGRLSRFGKIEGKNVFYWFQNHKARQRQKRRCPNQHQHTTLESEQEPAGFQVGQTKNNAASNCSTNSDQYSVSTQRAVEASESRAQGWIQLEERELLQQIRRTKNTQSKHATWQPMEPSSAPQAFEFMAKVRRTAPEEALNLSLSLAPSNRDMNVIKLEEAQTLELFPIRNCDRKAEKRVYEVSMASIDTSSLVPCQFFEFLPMKN